MNILNPIDPVTVTFSDPNWIQTPTINGTLKTKANGKMITASFNIVCANPGRPWINVYGWLNEITAFTPFAALMGQDAPPDETIKVSSTWPYPNENTSLDVSFILELDNYTHTPWTLTIKDFKIEVKGCLQYLPIMGVG